MFGTTRSRLLSVLAILLASLSIRAAIPTEQRDALIALYNATNGTNWTDNTNWLGEPGTECTWFGVIECADEGTRVSKLDLSGNNLVGSIPPEVGQLEVNWLWLQGNELTGPIPPELGDIEPLGWLDLSDNHLTGSIPPELGNFYIMHTLNLSNNELSGSIPRELAVRPGGNCCFSWVYLAGNQLSGEIPPEFGQLYLHTLDLSGNQLTGSIPRELGIPPTDFEMDFVDLNLSWNQLTGEIPPELGNLVTLEVLNLQSNQLSGEIPPELGNLENLKRLALHTNQLTGRIPPELGDLVSLTTLALSRNQLSGAIPPELARLAALESLYAVRNQLTGEIPQALGDLTRLKNLRISSNQLSGEIPASLANLSAIEDLWLFDNQLSGEIPPELGNLDNLLDLELDYNDLTGTIPPELANAKRLNTLTLGFNDLTGVIPPGLTNLPDLEILYLRGNRLSGTIPDFSQNTKLQWLFLDNNELTGSIPAALGSLQNLQYLHLRDNDLTGEIPPELGNLTTLVWLSLGGNHLEGEIPPALGNLANPNLELVLLDRNMLRGEIPIEFMNLGNVIYHGPDGDEPGIHLGYNALDTDDPMLRTYLDANTGGWDGRWDLTQTIPPKNLEVTGVTEDSLTLAWDPITFVGGEGGYEIWVTPNGGDATLAMTTASKSIDAATIAGLSPSTSYSVYLKSVSYPQLIWTTGTEETGPLEWWQSNTVTSDPSGTVTATTPAPVPEPAEVVATGIPGVLAQNAGEGGATAHYTLVNNGDLATAVTLTQTGSFFTQSPTEFTLEGGARQRITITGLAMDGGHYSGTSIPSGVGVSGSLEVRVRMIVTEPQTGTSSATSSTNRVDVSAPPEETLIPGSVDFTNIGATTIVAIVTADVAWIIPPEGTVTIEPGETVTIDFTIDRSKRPDADAPLGSVTGYLSLVYQTGTSASASMADFTPRDGITISTTLVSVVDTATVPVTPGGIPLLADGEVALFFPGIGHVRGTVGTFVTDLTLTTENVPGGVGRVDMYYMPPVSTSPVVSARLTSLAANQYLLLSDLIATIFGRTGETGTLQVRVDDPSTLHLGTVVFNKSHAAGTYGTAIPTLRSDRGVGVGENFAITGLQSETARRHTNFILQETSGKSVTLKIAFYGEDGTAMGDPVEQGIEPFGMARLNFVVPLGAVSAILEPTETSEGAFLGYATPVDDARELDGTLKGGDTWVVTDWGRVLGYVRTEPVVVPNAGSVRGANNTYFRTELSIFNPADELLKGDLAFVSRSGATIEKTIDLDAHQTLFTEDVMEEIFGAGQGSLGYLIFTPLRGEAVVTSRIFATVGDQVASFGTGVPVQALQSGLRPGRAMRIAGFQDSSIETINAQTPATFRTNFGLVELGGTAATVRVTLYFEYAAGLAKARGSASRDYELSAGQYLLLPGIAKEILGEARDVDFGNLSNLYVDFTLVDGDGPVAAFTASVDNGTGDQVLRTQ